MRKRRPNSGQSLIEFALIFPIIFFLITGFLDMGRAVFYYSSLTGAVREGARYATVHGTDLNAAITNPTSNPIVDKVRAFTFAITLPGNAVNVGVYKDEINLCTSVNTCPAKIKVSVTATYLFKPVTPGIKYIFGTKTGITITAHSTMRVAPASR